VIDAFRRKRQVLREGRGPVLLDTVTYRISGHSPSDASSYRSKEEIERWQQADSLRSFRTKLIDGSVAAAAALDEAKTAMETAVFDMFRLAADLEASPRITIDSELVGDVMFSNQRVEKFDDRKPEFLTISPRTRASSRIRGKIRTPPTAASRSPR
jgi:2-oxoisovalerate dehydrogenase E1 component